MDNRIEELRRASVDITDRAEETSEDASTDELNNCIDDMKNLADNALVSLAEAKP